MFEAYMKVLIKGGKGAWHVTRLEAETEEALNVKRDVLMAKAWGDATKEDYDAQHDAVRARSEEVAVQDADESQEDVEKAEESDEEEGDVSEDDSE